MCHTFDVIIRPMLYCLCFHAVQILLFVMVGRPSYLTLELIEYFKERHPPQTRIRCSIYS